MAIRLSRRKIASYYADELIAGRDIVRSLAAYLVDSRRLREIELIVRDIESALADRGVVVADVTTSRSLTDQAKTAIQTYIKATTGAKSIELRQLIDDDLIGGVKVAVPGRELDATIRHRLNLLKATKV
ncbi:hypothetical protein A2707_00380 [Candidatus Saccharibacteria bacterium RIFCSPHIGHO2_01_FULL_45_15]|nr:MAG: hypothetical protein A2707_00380 [Candidatus Saccharibacteria bacterium RIFCSPHIGHO2_01_FULL_45_15]OGL27484.1 MAG: hypothetical protein A3C39_03215 [Candidatus Saccharibacteria bacterium RIFCSPHIGHO2_02_FULL_46_12]OGL32140.1 MAG: hypothetical protein A3E76_04035 [Candidatus Saccharibacteria bacterium RIFCSPHIGHO2_12_FULL_44_22]